MDGLGTLVTLRFEFLVPLAFTCWQQDWNSELNATNGCVFRREFPLNIRANAKDLKPSATRAFGRVFNRKGYVEVDDGGLDSGT